MCPASERISPEEAECDAAGQPATARGPVKSAGAPYPPDLFSGVYAAPPMVTVRRHPLWLIAAAGLGLRLFLAFHWFGNDDILTFLLVGAEAKAHSLHIYATNVSGVFSPYPPGYLLWLVGAIRLSNGTAGRSRASCSCCPSWPIWPSPLPCTSI